MLQWCWFWCQSLIARHARRWFGHFGQSGRRYFLQSGRRPDEAKASELIHPRPRMFLLAHLLLRDVRRWLSFHVGPRSDRQTQLRKAPRGQCGEGARICHGYVVNSRVTYRTHTKKGGALLLTSAIALRLIFLEFLVPLFCSKTDFILYSYGPYIGGDDPFTFSVASTRLTDRSRTDFLYIDHACNTLIWDILNLLYTLVYLIFTWPVGAVGSMCARALSRPVRSIYAPLIWVSISLPRITNIYIITPPRTSNMLPTALSTLVYHFPLKLFVPYHNIMAKNSNWIYIHQQPVTPKQKKSASGHT